MKLNPVRTVVLSVAVLSTILFNFFALAQSLPTIGSLYQLGFLVIAPGILTALLLNLQRSGKLRLALYSVGLSLLWLLLGGLFINWLLPEFFGVSRPLSTNSLLVFYDLLILVQLSTLAVLKRDFGIFKWPAGQRLDKTHKFLLFCAILIPILATVGANRLNNHGSDHVTVAMLILIGSLVGYIGFNRKHIRSWVYPVVLFCIGAALLFMYSLRSWHIIGADINEEYQVFTAVLRAGRWYPHSTIDVAYNACLSITILPTVFALLTHIQSEYVYKLLFQVLFAFSPVMIYALARNMFDRKIAFFSAFAFAAQTWFIEQMPALNRQEIGLLFFILIFIALFDRHIHLWQQRLLFGFFTIGVVISHYSTAYIYLTLLLITLLIGHGSHFLFKVPRTILPRITWSKFLVVVAVIILWEGVITTSGSNITLFLSNIRDNAAEAFTSQSLTNGVSQLTFSDQGQSDTTNLNILYKSKISEYASIPKSNAYSPDITSSYRPVVKDDNFYTRSMLPALPTHLLLDLGKVSKLLVVDIFSIVGLILVIRGLRRLDANRREYVFLSMATIPLLGGIIFFPAVSQSYNTTRLFLQTYILLAPLSVYAAYQVVPKTKRITKSCAVTTLILIFFWYSCGLMNQGLGGLATITLNQPGGQYDSLYDHQSEVLAAEWLARIRNPKTPVYADILASYRLHSYANISDVNMDVFPVAITKDGYVYLDYANTTRDVGYVSYENNIITYNYPNKFLNSNKDLIYSSGTSEVYK
jgi:uncharacterized membrane protein